MIPDVAIQAAVLRIDELLGRLRGHLNAARGPGVPESACREIASATVMIASVRAECNAIKSEIAAARMTGQTPKAMKAEDMELHPAQLPRQVERERLLESLHRAGDHTLDPDNTDARPAEGRAA